MTFTEFIQKNPSAVEDASKCKNINEFKNLAKYNNIDYHSEQEIETAWKYIKNNKISDEDLISIAAGKGTKTIDINFTQMFNDYISKGYSPYEAAELAKNDVKKILDKYK